MKILIACEFSGRVRDAFIALGHDAVSCDLLESEIPGPHIKTDVLNVINDGWDMMIAHPSCTRLCNSGVRWLHERSLWAEMAVSALFFKSLLEAEIPKIAIENPVMHKHARRIVGRGPDFTIQPWELGAPYKKRLCFWTVGLPPLKKVAADLSGAAEDCWKQSPGVDRWKARSRTYEGVARQIAVQWG